MEIRPIRPEEYRQTGEVAVAAYSQLFGDDLGRYETELRAVAERATRCTVLVAVESDRVLGSVTYVPGPDTPASEFTDQDAAGMRMLAVDPEFQGRGIGRALTAACVDRARTGGKRRVVLHSRSEMTAARAMYLGMGFVATPHLDIFFTGPPFDETNPLHLLAYVLEL